MDAKGKTVYKDRWVKVEHIDINVKGRVVKYTKITESDVAVVIPVMNDGRLLLESILRPVVGKSLIEFPAGHIDHPEKPLFAAKREVKEETGYAVGKISTLFWEYSNPGSSQRKFYYFLAELAGKGAHSREEDEVIKLQAFFPKELEKLIRANKIKDHKTITAYLYYKSFIMGQKRA